METKTGIAPGGKPRWRVPRSQGTGFSGLNSLEKTGFLRSVPGHRALCCFLRFGHPKLHYNKASPDRPSSQDAMSLPRPTLKLDEQSFQDLLAAAYTIQEHNAKRKRGLATPRVCCHCGAPVKDDELLCGPCGAEQFRPGERLQRNWASLWLMSQQKNLWPERLPEKNNGALEIPASDPAGQVERLSDVEEETVETSDEETESTWSAAGAQADLEPTAPRFEVAPIADSLLIEARDANPSLRSRLWDLTLTLRFHRADLYLVVAIIVSTVAMIWVLSATPTPGPQRKPRLRPWEQALVSLGIAEPPAPLPQPDRGNPNIQVWVDPHTALYYCPGEDQYGKTPGGHVTTQKEAQMDQYGPAARAACD